MSLVELLAVLKDERMVDGLDIDLVVSKVVLMA
jgi:hypothetical protein